MIAEHIAATMHAVTELTTGPQRGIYLVLDLLNIVEKERAWLAEIGPWPEGLHEERTVYRALMVALEHRLKRAIAALGEGEALGELPFVDFIGQWGGTARHILEVAGKGKLN